ncbi:hypothetical protein LCGC14_2237810 [marine sediment metagenome]|uniref:Uncharacterized protein n=1 Tax=marine sediment metagenome TaxID=412755 RepID=A0A0F9G1D4_9ZZZZ
MLEFGTASTSYAVFCNKTLGESPCQNCGRMVTIILPFVGCVFCGDCAGADSGQYDGTEDFYDPRRLTISPD